MTSRMPIFRDLEAEPLDAEGLARVRSRLFADRRRSRSRARPVIVAGVLFAGAALAAPRWMRVEPVEPHAAINAPLSIEIVDENREIVLPELSPIVPPLKLPPPSPPRRSAAKQPAEVPAVEASTEVSTEASMLREALRFLRASRAEDALVTLNAYDRVYPDGELRDEATVARVRAWLVLGRNEIALATLQEMSLDRGARALELRLLRGELLAAAGRCAQAREDLELVSANAPSPEWKERIDRARCEEPPR